MMTNNKFPYSGQIFLLTMDNGLKVTNNYLADGINLEVEFISGELKGVKMQMPYTWKEISKNCFLISWQENDKSTVVHYDDFNQNKSHAFYTTMKGEFYKMEGIIEKYQ
ncbi:hypothetical protein [Apibacter sp. HY039]|uniref:MoaF-related domain-containing protein n=1 Tax=Apibacter sp. HY039 TaxID=2501476 RepID=UPI001C87B8FD|nr:hypothetical protein [Apibacter sp. HY039]